MLLIDDKAAQFEVVLDRNNIFLIPAEDGIFRHMKIVEYSYQIGIKWNIPIKSGIFRFNLEYSDEIWNIPMKYARIKRLLLV